MSNRNPGYLFGVVALGLLLSSPQILAAVIIGRAVFLNRGWGPIAPRIPGVGQHYYYFNVASQNPFWQDKFVYLRHTRTADSRWSQTVMGVDPETGVHSDLLTVTSRAGLHPVALDGQLELHGVSESFAVVDGAVRPFVAVRPPPGRAPQFLWNGQPAFVEKGASGFVVSALSEGSWTRIGTVVLPDSGIDSGSAHSLECRSHGGHIHVLLHAGRRLLYSDRLELVPDPQADAGTGNEPMAGNAATGEPLSALRPANNAGWSIVCPVAEGLTSDPSGIAQFRYSSMRVDGQPAVLVVDNWQTGHGTGRIHRFDGTAWTEIASIRLPFGAREFRTVTTGDGTRSYVVITTSTGIAHIYAVDANGVRRTAGTTKPSQALLLHDWMTIGLVFAAALILGTLQGAATWLLMWRFTKPGYAFGRQTVRMASLARRGAARLIDLGTVVLTTLGLSAYLTRGFDWISLIEALNLQVPHPTIAAARTTAAILAAWFILLIAALILAQARWGLTPGKWICRLRLLRSTLQPCGIARSLTREVVFFVDCCNLLCWAPGIVSLALSDHRRRLGDHVADTIVVDSGSLIPSETNHGSRTTDS